MKIPIGWGLRSCRAKLRWCASLLFLGAVFFSPHALAQIVFVPTTLPPGTQGLSYNQTITANDSDFDDVSGPPDGDDIFTLADEFV